MPIAPHIQRLRAHVGHDLLVLPSVAVLPRNDQGDILLVRTADTGQWAAIGGAVEPDESPETCALREAWEEAGVRLRLGEVLAVLGGPDFRMTYPNGDQTAYVSTVFGATIASGIPAPDGDETTEVGWWPPDHLPVEEMSAFTRSLLIDSGLASTESMSSPLLVLVTGVQGTGKSTVAEIVADDLHAPLIAHDWAMSALRPYPSLQRALDDITPAGHHRVGWSILRALARSHLRRGRSVVLDGIAQSQEISELRDLADSENASLVVFVTECSDERLHRSRVETRRREIPDWYELDWDHVRQAKQRWKPVAADLAVDASSSLDSNHDMIVAYLRTLSTRRAH